ncbi:MAG: dolichol-phosphate mannosyltransferase, partial [Cytophagales bacterium]|nr:dolichol-phosphate mannosyltransferase [Cytophagales bacterium]
MANEEADFAPFAALLQQVLEKLESGHVYFVVDKVSKDNTLGLCQALSGQNPRFVT